MYLENMPHMCDMRLSACSIYNIIHTNLLLHIIYIIKWAYKNPCRPTLVKHDIYWQQEVAALCYWLVFGVRWCHFPENTRHHLSLRFTSCWSSLFQLLFLFTTSRKSLPRAHKTTESCFYVSVSVRIQQARDSLVPQWTLEVQVFSCVPTQTGLMFPFFMSSWFAYSIP